MRAMLILLLLLVADDDSDRKNIVGVWQLVSVVYEDCAGQACA